MNIEPKPIPAEVWGVKAPRISISNAQLLIEWDKHKPTSSVPDKTIAPDGTTFEEFRQAVIQTEIAPQYADRRFDGAMSIRTRVVGGVVYAVVSDNTNGTEQFKQAYPVNGTNANGNHVRKGLESLPLDLVCEFVMSKIAEPGIIRDYYEQGSPLEGVKLALFAAQQFGITLPENICETVRTLIDQNPADEALRNALEKALGLVPA